MEAISVLSVFLTEGGPITLVIFAVFIGGAAIAIERMIAVVSATREPPRRLATEALAMIDRNNVTGALELCRGSRTIAGATLAEVLDEAASNPSALTEQRLLERTEHSLALQTMPVSKRIDLLSTIANAATLLGLLGTVLALRQTLVPGPTAAAGAAGAAAASALLGAGIARALQSTALGIVAALPLLVAQSLLRSRIETALGEAREAADSIASVLVKRARAEEAARSVLAREKSRHVRARDPEVAPAMQPAAAASAAAAPPRATVVVR
jgi:biopolymer transport protein ExbB/TolQ